MRRINPSVGKAESLDRGRNGKKLLVRITRSRGEGRKKTLEKGKILRITRALFIFLLAFAEALAEKKSDAKGVRRWKKRKRNVFCNGSMV
jgi:hypothetical protein